jgi:hypothetical protein
MPNDHPNAPLSKTTAFHLKHGMATGLIQIGGAHGIKVSHDARPIQPTLTIYNLIKNTHITLHRGINYFSLYFVKYASHGRCFNQHCSTEINDTPIPDGKKSDGAQKTCGYRCVTWRHQMLCN